MLTIEHITKRYGSFIALEDITLTLTPQVYGLLAPNGAGKTTLLNLVTTLLTPTSGTITWEGEEINAMGERYRQLVGYVPQRYGYYPHYTPTSMLAYAAALQRMPKGQVKARIAELLELVGLSDVAHKRLRTFSGGMLQRVGIAQAILHDPKVLILDEPTAGLDPKERVRFRNLIRSMAADRIVILSTHIVSDIETIADEIIMLRDHHLHCCAPRPEICATLDGKVYEVPLGTALDPAHLVLGERVGDKGQVVRIVVEQPSGAPVHTPSEQASSAVVPPGAVPVAPTLEDAFLYVYREAHHAGI